MFLSATVDADMVKYNYQLKCFDHETLISSKNSKICLSSDSRPAENDMSYIYCILIFWTLEYHEMEL
jgi:hypothetical protein